jgi:hypothetical protein
MTSLAILWPRPMSTATASPISLSGQADTTARRATGLTRWRVRVLRWEEPAETGDASINAAVTITGADANDKSGTLVAAIDVNSDNRAEVIGSAPDGAGPDDKRRAAGEISIIDIAAASSNTIHPAKAGASVRLFDPNANEFAASSRAATALG